MKQHIRRHVSYECEICKTKYSTKKDALKCEKLPVEKPIFRSGERVRVKEERECGAYGLPGKKYFAAVRIIKVLPLSPGMRWPGYETGKHEHTYLCKWQCPHCNEIREGVFNPAEIAPARVKAAICGQGKRR